jgi:hypothetical protein
MQAFEDCSIDTAFYANRERGLEEVLPWQHIDTGVSREFLKDEYLKSVKETATEDCRHGHCNSCGLERLHTVCGASL